MPEVVYFIKMFMRYMNRTMGGILEDDAMEKVVTGVLCELARPFTSFLIYCCLENMLLASNTVHFENLLVSV